MAFSGASSTILLLLFTGGLMMSHLLTLVSAVTGNRLNAGKFLLTNNFLSHGSYYLRVRYGCDIVFENEETGHEIWSPKTKGEGFYCRLHMNPNGKLEILQGMGEGGARVWNSGTASRNCRNSYLQVAEGTVSIHNDTNDVIWANGKSIAG